MKCENCGHWNDAGTNHCISCGQGMAQKKVCSQGHTIPPTLQDCPWCPKPAGRARAGTQVEPSLAAGGGGASPPPFSNASSGGNKRAGTMVVGPGSLPGGSGGLGTAAPKPPPLPTGMRGGGGRKGKTMVVAPGQSIGEPTMGVPAPTTGGASPFSSASQGVRGASPLAGFLVSFSADPNGMFWPIRMGRTRLGSGDDCDIQLDHAGVSGNHANINVHDNRGMLKIWITDQDSMNGTRLNGDSIFNDKPDLTHGDRIGIGDVEMQLILLPGQ